jgi:chromosome segregation ATPase
MSCNIPIRQLKKLETMSDRTEKAVNHYKGKGEHSINQLELIVEQQKEELHKLKSNSQPLNLEIEQLTKERDELNKNINSLIEERRLLADKLGECGEQLQAVTKERDELKRENQQLSNDLNDCREAFSGVDDLLKAEQDKVKELKEVLTKIRDCAATHPNRFEEYNDYVYHTSNDVLNSKS